MNESATLYYREELKEKLALCTEKQQEIFKCMYSPKDTTLPIDQVVDQMDERSLDWALSQVERTLMKKS